MYIKAHPFGYVPRKKNFSDHKFEPKYRTQTCVMKVPYQVYDRDESGNIIGVNTYYNTIVKPIQHYGHNPNRKGITLAERVYASLMLHPREAGKK